ncbi:acylneuraminate cytidylyltransferase [bacterium]|nr:MAG: acylneuraminate cytidylyltransferase [bacterium]
MNPERIIVIIQARMSSTRLPGKVLKDIAGRPMLAWVVERARKAKTVTEVVVATTVEPADDPIAAFCEQMGYACTRGSLEDVLDRFYQTARQYRAGVIVRVTADCPLIDPGEIDHVVREFQRSGVDFAANRLPPPFGRTYPIGLDTEVCSFAALEHTWQAATEPYQREHVMPYIYEAPGRFKVLRVDHDPDYGELRWTVDTPQDLELVRAIFERMAGRGDFTWLDVLELFQREPELARLNAGVGQKFYNKHG